MFFHRIRPIRALAIGLVALLGCLAFLWQRHPIWVLPSRALPAEQANDEFWKRISVLWASATPRCPPPTRNCNAKPLHWTQVNSTIDVTPQNCLSMPETDILAMRESHQTFVKAIVTNPPKMSYVIGSRGLVTTAGSALLPQVVISLRMLRKTGCQLPMEVFLSNHRDWEPNICSTILPSFNARCIVQSSHLRATASNEPPSRYLNKIVSILTSTFSELLFLDADCFPIVDPTKVFTTVPFTSTGLITFPDYWAMTASVLFYNITQIPFVPLTARQTTESGQVFISKPHHELSLLLTMYYNHFGQNYYSALISQGAPGEGDKEFFLAAASVFNEPYYAVHTRVQSLGHMVGDSLDGSAMVQYDPVEDYLITTNSSLDTPTNPPPPPHPMFIHNNFPKFDPRLMFTQHAYILIDPSTGSYRRAWTGRQETLSSFGFDVQRSYWGEILWVSCELEGQFRAWKGTYGICEKTRGYWEAVFGEREEAQ